MVHEKYFVFLKGFESCYALREILGVKRLENFAYTFTAKTYQITIADPDIRTSG